MRGCGLMMRLGKKNNLLRVKDALSEKPRLLLFLIRMGDIVIWQEQLFPE